jgi:hypothetical protein
MLASAPSTQVLPLEPAVWDLAVYRGDSYGWRIVCWADVDKTTPVDLTGVVAAAQVRPGHSGPVEVEFDIAVTLPNIIDIVLTAAKSRSSGSGRWDLELTFPSGEVRTILVGNVTVTDDITQEGTP